MAVITNDEKSRLINAILRAEENTSGEIRVHLQRKAKGYIYESAAKKFEKLGMTKTQHRNGVLIYVALNDKKFAIIGDSGLHLNLHKHFWDNTAEAMTKHFKDGDIIGGIEKGIEKAGDELKKYFPYKDDDVNELSNEISIEE